MTLKEMLAPLSIEQFLADYVGQQFLVLPPVSGRFRGIVSWAELSDVLSRVNAGDGLVSLVRQGRDIPKDLYTSSRRDTTSQYLIGPAVRRFVLDGATLVVNHVDVLLPALRPLVESCEDVFRINVQANLYAAWRTDNGFDVHWDRHDTLIVQVLGRKNWKVWRPTRVHPLGDEQSTTPSPSEDPVWEGTLEDGAVLYMPRGWWHVANPRDETSLHITLGLQHPTGLHLLDWLVDQMRESLALRCSVPHWKRVSDQRAWLQSVREACLDAIRDDAIQTYMDHIAAGVSLRPVVHLPDEPQTRLKTKVDDRTPLRLIQLRKLPLRMKKGTMLLAFEANGKTWQCSELLQPALSLLDAVVPSTVEDMLGAVIEDGKPLVRPFVFALLSAHVIWADLVRPSGEFSTVR